jgi:hypothetical protein
MGESTANEGEEIKIRVQGWRQSKQETKEEHRKSPERGGVVTDLCIMVRHLSWSVRWAACESGLLATG